MSEFRGIMMSSFLMLLLHFPGRLRLIMVSVGLAALIITVVTVYMWTRAKGSKAQTEENMERYDVDDGTVIYENIRPPDGV
ncbi:Serine/arginine repetitive matrix protein 5 [Dissostichus eleginoides]|uniref:Serine/arginine repetitive matrix protein 5 n=1 Tax=Dissostichus eleginoides TaxID=100907 RepID=A0AAD9BVK9_DISEL|nr:Serine/arginine repetitive matrix protein 5 [Dissostichus eleginoides]